MKKKISTVAGAADLLNAILSIATAVIFFKKILGEIFICNLFWLVFIKKYFGLIAFKVNVF